MDCRDPGLAVGHHAGFLGHFASLAKVAGRACRNDIFPGGQSPSGAWNEVIERQISLIVSAILAFKLVPQKKIEAGESRVPLWTDILLEADDAWQFHLKRWRRHRSIVFGHDVHAFQKYRFDSILPGPERERVI